MNRSAEYEKKRRALLGEFEKNLAGPRASFSLAKPNSNLFRNRVADRAKKLDVNGLNQVIAIDPEKRVAEVEAMITYEDLVKTTLEYECLPCVVPELKTITIGGAIVGLGIESSSFRYGLVHETILEMEVLTGEGKIVFCTPENENRDLFYAFPNSYGTLGYVLKVKLKLIRAKKFVRLTNFHFQDPKLFFEKLENLCLIRRMQKADSYIDGVVFDSKKMAIILGEFVDQAPFLSDYTYMKSYYQSIPQFDLNYLTTHDYIWRWDPDWFWCSKHFGMNSKFLRFLFGKFMLHSKSYWKIKHLAATHPLIQFLSRFQKPTESVIQDILIPSEKALPFLEFFQSQIGIKPIWICPFHTHRAHPTPLFPIDPQKLYFDFGFWDLVPTDAPPGFFNRLIEEKTLQLKGFKSLYSDSFFTEEEFWAIFPKATYQQLKNKYDPKQAFKDLYSKCVKKN